jgi:ribosomal protein S27E
MAIRYSQNEAVQIMLRNDLKPLEPFTNTQKPWKSKCLKCSKVVQPRLQKVLMRGHQCKFCSGHQIDGTDAKKIMLSHGFTPLTEYPGANKPWKSRCKTCGKTPSPSLTSVKKGIGCKFCSNRAVDPHDAIRAMKERGFRVLTDFPGAVAPWKVQCLNCKKIFETKFHSLKTKNRCKYCAGVVVEPRNLEKKLTELKLKPLEPYRAAKTPWKCKCLVCGHIVQPTWNRIKQNRGHCAYCAQRRIYIPDALKLLKKLKLKPLVDFPGNNKPWACRCLICGEEASPRWSDLNRGQGGCSNCADYGLNYTKPGYLYLMINNNLNSGKIGIGNTYKNTSKDDRITRHQKRGWELIKKKNFSKLKNAYSEEQRLLKWLRNDVSIPIHLSATQMPQGGWTETFDLSLIDISDIEAKFS